MKSKHTRVKRERKRNCKQCYRKWTWGWHESFFSGFMTLTLTLSLHQMTLTPYYKGICTLHLLNLHLSFWTQKISFKVISDSNHQLMTLDSDSPFKNLPNQSGVKSHDSWFVSSLNEQTLTMTAESINVGCVIFPQLIICKPLGWLWIHISEIHLSEQFFT